MTLRVARYVLAVTLTVTVVGSASAVPYASFVRNTGGASWEFVVNENADVVTVLRDGGNPVVLSTSAGRKTFDMTGFNDFEIQVSKSAPEAWTTISDLTNKYTRFERPNGLVLNNDPSHEFFGSIYVLNGTNLAAAGVNGRPTGDGVYALTADMLGVDLVTELALTDPNDTSAAKAPGWKVDNPTHPGTGGNPPTPLQLSENVSAWRLGLDASGNVIASDWSDINGGVNWASADLSTGGRLLGRGYNLDGSPTGADAQTGPTGGVFSLESDEIGPLPLHGSIVSKPYVTGTVGVDLTLWAMDEDLDTDLSHPGNDGNSIWKWNIGAATDFDALAPDLVVDAGSVPGFLGLNSGVLANAHFSPQHGKWYLTQNRSEGTNNDAGLVIVTPDNGNGMSPTLEWSSAAQSVANNLDGNAGPAGIQDIFRQFGAGITISADGTELYMHRAGISPAPSVGPPVATSNPVLGVGTNLSGSVLVIPLDENGLPIIEITDGMITNWDSITTISNTSTANRREVAVDLAGNVYTTNNSSELLQVFSPGGSFTAITGSDGTFSLEAFAPPEGLVGDYNNDGSVNAADYAVWRDNNGGTAVLLNDATPGTVDASDYATWRANFGNTAGSGSAAVPEPSTFGLALLVAAAVLSRFIKRS